eukprot:5214799-Prymnesium_polylepis.1
MLRGPVTNSNTIHAWLGPCRAQRGAHAWTTDRRRPDGAPADGTSERRSGPPAPRWLHVKAKAVCTTCY